MHLMPIGIVLLVLAVGVLSFIGGFWSGWYAHEDPELVAKVKQWKKELNQSK